MTDATFEDQLFGKKVIDNRNVSMTDALKYLLKKEEFRILDVAVGYFYISGLLLLKDEFYSQKNIQATPAHVNY